MAKRKRRYVLCVNNGSYKASLEPRKVYRVMADPAAEARALLRVIDDSGEDYLFPGRLFVPLEVPEKAETVFTLGASAAR